jgi:hypothetical protein
MAPPYTSAVCFFSSFAFWNVSTLVYFPGGIFVGQNVHQTIVKYDTATNGPWVIELNIDPSTPLGKYACMALSFLLFVFRS